MLADLSQLCKSKRKGMILEGHEEPKGKAIGYGLLAIVATNCRF